MEDWLNLENEFPTSWQIQTGCVQLKWCFSLLYTFCLYFYLINIHIFDYPDSRLSGLFTKFPMILDNRGLTVIHQIMDTMSNNLMCITKWLTSLSSLGKSAPSGIPVFSCATFFRSLANFFWVSNVLFILRYSPWKDKKKHKN